MPIVVSHGTTGFGMPGTGYGGHGGYRSRGSNSDILRAWEAMLARRDANWQYTQDRQWDREKFGTELTWKDKLERDLQGMRDTAAMDRQQLSGQQQLDIQRAADAEAYRRQRAEWIYRGRNDEERAIRADYMAEMEEASATEARLRQIASGALSERGRQTANELLQRLKEINKLKKKDGWNQPEYRQKMREWSVDVGAAQIEGEPMHRLPLDQEMRQNGDYQVIDGIPFFRGPRGTEPITDVYRAQQMGEVARAEHQLKQVEARQARHNKHFNDFMAARMKEPPVEYINADDAGKAAIVQQWQQDAGRYANTQMEAEDKSWQRSQAHSQYWRQPAPQGAPFDGRSQAAPQAAPGGKPAPNQGSAAGSTTTPTFDPGTGGMTLIPIGTNQGGNAPANLPPRLGGRPEGTPAGTPATAFVPASATVAFDPAGGVVPMPPGGSTNRFNPSMPGPGQTFSDMPPGTEDQVYIVGRDDQGRGPAIDYMPARIQPQYSDWGGAGQPYLAQPNLVGRTGLVEDIPRQINYAFSEYRPRRQVAQGSRRRQPYQMLL